VRAETPLRIPFCASFAPALAPEIRRTLRAVYGLEHLDELGDPPRHDAVHLTYPEHGVLRAPFGSSAPDTCRFVHVYGNDRGDDTQGLPHPTMAAIFSSFTQFCNETT
jgi:hypothetical protein